MGIGGGGFSDLALGFVVGFGEERGEGVVF